MQKRWIGLLAILVSAVGCGGNEEPSASFTITNSNASSTGTVSLDANDSSDSDGQIVSYQWQFSDGSTAEGVTVSHTFADLGEYTIGLTVTDNDGAQTQYEKVFEYISNETFSLSGEIRAFSQTDIDGDVNDPNAPVFNNNGDTVDDFQPLANPVMLNGFLTSFSTNVNGDAFAFKTDLDDAYRVNLKEGDFVSLRVINFFEADLDLYLLDPQTYDVIRFSDSVHEYEAVQAPEDNEYIVLVTNLGGASTYLLKIGNTTLGSVIQPQGQPGSFKENEFIVKTRRSDALEHMQRAQLNVTHKRLHKRPGLAKMNPLNPQTRAQLNMQSATAQRGVIARTNPETSAKIDTVRALKALRRQSDVELAELNFKVEPLYTPDDPYYIDQWHHAAIDASLGWDQTLGSAEVIVAVVDSGIFSRHPDLQGQLLPGYDFIGYGPAAGDGDGIDPNPEDEGGNAFSSGSYHGTHVAGVVAALGDNGIGGLGVAPGVKVMPLRSIGLNGGYNYDVQQAVRFAAGLENDSGTRPSQAADVINLSLGGGGFSFAGRDLYREVRQKGIVVVAASGNQNSGIPLYPASYDSVISVAATDYLDERAPYSNFGPFVDIAAPGGDTNFDRNNDGWSDGILSTGVQVRLGTEEPGYVYYQGTSMATPIVSGVIALMKSIYPSLTPDELDALIALGELTHDKGLEGRDDYYGFGLISAEKATAAAAQLAGGTQFAALLPNKYTLLFDEITTSQAVQLRSVGGAGVQVLSYAVDSSWLSLTPINDGTNGVSYRAEVDISNLPEGDHRDKIRFQLSNDQQLVLYVNVRIGNFSEPGDAGHLYVQLFDADSDELIENYDALPSAGVYSYEFNDLPAGDYYLLAGTDIDNDGFLCVEGEACGFFPSLDAMEKISVISDVNGIDFWVGTFDPVVIAGQSTLLLPLSLGSGIMRFSAD